ncbi:MAG: type II secretion system F family protein [Acidimicrobiia bacterium]
MTPVVAAASGGSWMLIAGAGALFVALFLVVAAVTLPGVRRRRLAKELAGPAEGASVRSQMSSLGTKATALAERGLARHDRDRVIASALERAGIDMRAAEYVLVTVAAAFGGAVVGGMLGDWVTALIVAGLTVTGFVAAVQLKASRRHKRFEEQLPNSLSLIAGGLRAGHSLSQAIDALVQESEAPTSDEFRRALFETQLGHTLPSALHAMAQRVRSEDFGWVVQAIDIQREVGGDLSAVLDNVTRTIRDRTRVRRQIDSLTAEGRISAVVLFGLPIVVLLVLSLINPGYLGELFSTFAGTVMLIVAGSLMAAGGFWLRRIVRLVY